MDMTQNTSLKVHFVGRSWKVALFCRVRYKLYFLKVIRKIMLDSTSTVQEICEAANGFRFKAKGRVHVCRTRREDVSWVTELALVTFSHLGSFSFYDIAFSLFLAFLCLQLETQADFVPATVHVLPIEQTGEGELHSWEGRRVNTRLCRE